MDNILIQPKILVSVGDPIRDKQPWTNHLTVFHVVVEVVLTQEIQPNAFAQLVKNSMLSNSVFAQVTLDKHLLTDHSAASLALLVSLWPLMIQLDVSVHVV